MNSRSTLSTWLAATLTVIRFYSLCDLYLHRTCTTATAVSKLWSAARSSTAVAGWAVSRALTLIRSAIVDSTSLSLSGNARVQPSRICSTHLPHRWLLRFSGSNITPNTIVHLGGKSQSPATGAGGDSWCTPPLCDLPACTSAIAAFVPFS